jgi:hypothetical protein
MGDLHGDLKALDAALALSGFLDHDGQSWAARNVTLVQVGDIFDRGPDSLPILYKLQRMREEAASAGSEVKLLLGNPDEMNLIGRTEMVPPSEKAKVNDWDGLMDIGAGGVGQFLGSLDVAAVRGEAGCKSLFVHAGLLPEYVPPGGNLSQLNDDAREEIRERQQFGRRGKRGGLLSENGPLWYRGLASGRPRECNKAEQTLRLLGAKRMVIGHTVQKGGRIRTACGGLVHMIDVGMSAWIGGAPPGVWTCTNQLNGGYKVSALYESGPEVIEQSPSRSLADL